MFDEKHRCALIGDLHEQSPEALGLPVVLTGRGLVEEQYPRLARESPPQLDQTALSGGNRGGPFVGYLAQADTVDHSLGEGPHVGVVAGPSTSDVRGHPDVLTHGQHREQLELLERPCEAASCPLVQARTRHVPAVDGDGATCGCDQPGDGVEEGGLAGSVGSDQPGDLTRGCRYGNPTQGLMASELHRDVAGLKHRGPP